MAKAKYKKKDPEAEQQTTSGFLNPSLPPPINLPFSPGDWIITNADGSRQVVSDAEFTATHEKV
jgi:hypothetical protein